jgi:hypothetical protein
LLRLLLLLSYRLTNVDPTIVNLGSYNVVLIVLVPDPLRVSFSSVILVHYLVCYIITGLIYL